MALNQAQFSSKLIWVQCATFGALYIGYCLFCINRKSYSYVIPALLQDDYNNKEIGATLSSLALGYCIGRVLSGILVDKCKPSLLFGIGLILTGTLNICLGFAPSCYHNAIWFTNGLVQGQGWAACGKIVNRFVICFYSSFNIS